MNRVETASYNDQSFPRLPKRQQSQSFSSGTIRSLRCREGSSSIRVAIGRAATAIPTIPVIGPPRLRTVVDASLRKVLRAVVNGLLVTALAGCGANTGLAVPTADGAVAGNSGSSTGSDGGAGAPGAAGAGPAGNGGTAGQGGASVGHGGDSAGQGGGAGQGGSAGGAPIAAPAACSAPMGDRVYIDDAAAIKAALPGTWARCGHALTSNEGEVGIRIGADGRFALLVAAADGSVTPSISLLESGQVVVTPHGPFNGHLTFTLDFASDANVTYETFPFFTNGMPLELVTTNTDIFWLRYVRTNQ